MKADKQSDITNTPRCTEACIEKRRGNMRTVQHSSLRAVRICEVSRVNVKCSLSPTLPLPHANKDKSDREAVHNVRFAKSTYKIRSKLLCGSHPRSHFNCAPCWQQFYKLITIIYAAATAGSHNKFSRTFAHTTHN